MDGSVLLLEGVTDLGIGVTLVHWLLIGAIVGALLGLDGLIVEFFSIYFRALIC